MGDEQGGIYYPEALILANAVDVVRVDLTCMGGITARSPHHRPGPRRGPRLRAAHVPARPLPGHGCVGLRRRSHRVGHPVHRRPPDGRPAAAAGAHGRRPDGGLLPEEPGFGHLVDADWARSQPHDDPHGILRASDGGGHRAPAAGQRGWWLEDAVPGTVLRHPGGRTIGSAEHVWLAWITHNVSDVHGNAHAAARNEWGQPLVLGMLTAAIVIGLAARPPLTPDRGAIGMVGRLVVDPAQRTGGRRGHADGRVGHPRGRGAPGRAVRPGPTTHPGSKPAGRGRGFHRRGARRPSARCERRVVAGRSAGLTFVPLSVDVCVGNTEVSSRLRYGGWFARSVDPGNRTVRFRAASAAAATGTSSAAHAQRRR